MNKKSPFRKLVQLKTYKIVIPLFPFFVLYFIFYIFFTQKKQFYKRNNFEMNDDLIELYESYTTKDSNFDIYYINNNSKYDLIYLHGSRIKKEIHVEIAKKLNTITKYNIILPFYRGYGTSKGRLNEINIMGDMHLLKNAIKNRNTIKYLFGQSLGAAVAVYLGTILEAPKIILENPFYNARTIIKQFRFTKYINFLLTEKWETNKRIVNVKSIFMILLSEKDKLVHNKNGRMLADLVNNCTVETIEDATHFNAFKKQEFYKHVEGFINE
ncbi:bem46 protein [Binucleata daphniae]